MGNQPATFISVQLHNDTAIFIISLKLSDGQKRSKRQKISKRQSPASVNENFRIEPENSATLVVGLSPRSPVLGQISDSFIIRCAEGAQVLISYEISTQQSPTFDFLIRIEDEETFSMAERPLVGGAEIRLSSAVKRFEDTRFTNQLAPVTFFSITPGFYELSVSAPDHQSVRKIIFASNSQRSATIFLPISAKEEGIVFRKVAGPSNFSIDWKTGPGQRVIFLYKCE